MNTIEDEIALRNLMARYVDAVNRRDGDAWIGTWAEDGAWDLFGEPVTGRDAILTLWQQAMASFEFALLMPASCLFEVAGDRATGHWYLHEYTRDLAGTATAIISRYDDTYERVAGQWLYSSRKYHFIYRGAPDLGGDYAPPP